MAHQYKQHPSPTGHLIGGQLVPVPEAVAATETVWLVLPIESRFRLKLRKDRIWEGLGAEVTDAEDRVIVRAVPLFAYDVNYGDELSVVTSGEGALVATGITKDAGNYTFRIWMHKNAGDDAFRDVLTQFGVLGCLIEGYSDRLIGLSCSPENAHDVADALEMAEQEGRFTYETGRQRTSLHAATGATLPS